IATNILADRLHKLVACGIIATQPDPSDGRKLIYSLTAKGIDLAPVLTEMVLWAAGHENTGNQALVRQMRAGKLGQTAFGLMPDSAWSSRTCRMPSLWLLFRKGEAGFFRNPDVHSLLV